MSYQVLARKWRPRSFDTLVGQEHVVRALTHALEQQRLHHAYLFTGTRGVGKTTIARIMAKALNCETGITARPCGVCSACVEIDGGRFVDLIEVDAATNTKVDEMRQLLENATYAPTRGRFKVYVIDEVHMLSNSAFNAMLKTLEEPPEHIKFILATTDPQKIPVTVLSRCLQFNLKQMPLSHIINHLTRILEQEQVPCEAAALKHLAKAAAGSMRDALSLLDQAIAHGAGQVVEEQVRDMLGTVGDDYLYGILDALAAGDVAALMAVAERMNARSLSAEAALQDLATLFHRIALAQFAPQALADDGERQRLEPYAHGSAAFDAEFLQLAYQITIHGRNDLALAPDEQAGLCMTLLRLFAFRPETAATASLPVASVSSPRTVSAPAPAPAASSAARPKIPAAVPQIPVAAAPAAQQVARQPDPEPVQSVAAAPATPPGMSATVPEAAAPVASVVSSTPVAEPAMTRAAAKPASGLEDWHGICQCLTLTGGARSLAQHCELLDLGVDEITLRLPPAQKPFLNKANQEKLETALQQHLARPLRLNIVLANTAGETPVERKRQQRQERQEQAVVSIRNDAFVQQTVDLFGAVIDESSIKPLDPEGV